MSLPTLFQRFQPPFQQGSNYPADPHSNGFQPPFQRGVFQPPIPPSGAMRALSGRAAPEACQSQLHHGSTWRPKILDFCSSLSGVQPRCWLSLITSSLFD
jgi:hypothetical protein